MENGRKFYRALAAVLALAAALRLVPLLVIGPQAEPDTRAYLSVAALLAETGNFSWNDNVTGRTEPYAYRMPLFHVYAAGLMKAFGPDITLPLAVSNFIFSLAAVLLAVLLVRALAGPAAGLLAGLLSALNPNAVFNAALLLTDNLFVLANLLVVAAGLLALRRRSGWAFFLWGLSIGACVMVRPVMKLYWPLPLLLPALPAFAASAKAKARLGALFLAGILLLLLPWAARNKARAGFFGLELNQGANTLWSSIDLVQPSTPEEAQADPLAAKIRDIAASSPNPLKAEDRIRAELGLSLPEASAALSRLGAETALRNPGAFSLRFLKNFVNVATSPSAVLELAGRLSGGGPNSMPGIGRALREKRLGAAALHLAARAALFAVFFVLAPLGALLLWRGAGPAGRLELLVPLSLIAYTVPLTALVAGYDRYRLPLDPLLFGFAAAWLLAKYRGRAA